MEDHIKLLLGFLLGSIIAFAVIGSLPNIFEKIFLGLAVVVIDIGFVYKTFIR